MAELTSEQSLTLFTNLMLNKQKTEVYIGETEVSNHEIYKSKYINMIKPLFESIDSLNHEEVLSKCLDISNIAFFIAKNFGKLNNSKPK